MPQSPAPSRLRREPPAFRRLEVRAREHLTARLVRVTVSGDELAGFEMPAPAGSVRLLLPPAGSDTLTTPTWNGNEFLDADGSRPLIRTLTPRHHRGDIDEMDVDVVVHGDTPLATWATDAPLGSPVALSGPGRGYDIDASAESFLLAGDESAVPAIGQLLEALPDVPITVIVEAHGPDPHLPEPATLTQCQVRRVSPDTTPGSALVDAVRDADVTEGTHVWAAGEAASMQAIRRHLFEDRSVQRSRAVVRGYWKVSRGRGVAD